jgi:hypothetical protein
MVTRMTIRIRTQKNPNRFQSQSFFLSLPFLFFFSVFSFLSLSFFFFPRLPVIFPFLSLATQKSLGFFPFSLPQNPCFSSPWRRCLKSLSFLSSSPKPSPFSCASGTHTPFPHALEPYTTHHTEEALLSLSRAVPISSPASLSSALCVGHQ